MDNFQSRPTNRKFYISIGGSKVFYEVKKRSKRYRTLDLSEREQMNLPGLDEFSNS